MFELDPAFGPLSLDPEAMGIEPTVDPSRPRSPKEEARHRARTGAARTLRRCSHLRGKVLATLPEVDRSLPGGGLERGSLVDLHAISGGGAFRLALRLAAALQQRADRQAVVVVVDPAGDLYPPAFAQAGLDLSRVLLTIPPRDEVLGCLDEALRSSVVVAVVARITGLDGSASHRLRHAARSGGGVGLLVRPACEVDRISGAAVRLSVRGTLEGLQIAPFRLRGGQAQPWSVDR